MSSDDLIDKGPPGPSSPAGNPFRTPQEIQTPRPTNDAAQLLRDIRMETARKQVRFDIADLTRTLRADREPKTFLHQLVRDSGANRLSGVADAQAATLAEDDEYAVEVPVTYESFKLEVAGLQNHRLTSGEIDQDLLEKAEAYAARYGHAEEPAVPFLPLSDAGKQQWPNANGPIDVHDFKERFKENPGALFQEFKAARFLAMAGHRALYQNMELVKHINSDLNIVVEWAHHLGELTEKTPNGFDHTTCHESVRDKDSEIAELKATIADIIQDKRAQDRKTPSLAGTNPSPTLATRNLFGNLPQQAFREALGPVMTPRVPNLPPARAPATNQSNNPFVRQTSLAPTLPTISNSDAGRRSAKHTDPTPYHNEKDKDKVPFGMYFMTLVNKLTINHDWYPEEVDRCALIISTLAGKAARDFLPYVQEGNPFRLTTSDEMLKHIWAYGSDVDRPRKAHDEWLALMMAEPKTYESEKIDFGVFRNTFTRLAAENQIPPLTWKAEFERRLIAALRRGGAMSFLDDTVKYNDYVLLINKLDNTNRQANASEQARRDAKPKIAAPATANPAASRGGRGGYNGGQGRGGHTGPHVSSIRVAQERGMSQGALVNAINQGLCYRCQKPGHLARDCDQTAVDNGGTNYVDRREARIAEVEARYGNPAISAYTPNNDTHDMTGSVAGKMDGKN